jgi:hypothetical protein
MTGQTKRRVLIAVCSLLVAFLVSRVFYLQELFFAFLFFAVGFLILLLAAGLAVGLWFLYARIVVYLATRTAEKGHHALPLVRVLVLWLAPTVTKTAAFVAAGQQVLLHPFGDLLHHWLQSFQMDASHLREDTERAARNLRLLLKQS